MLFSMGSRGGFIGQRSGMSIGLVLMCLILRLSKAEGVFVCWQLCNVFMFLCFVNFDVTKGQ